MSVPLNTHLIWSSWDVELYEHSKQIMNIIYSNSDKVILDAAITILGIEAMRVGLRIVLGWCYLRKVNDKYSAPDGLQSGHIAINMVDNRPW